MQKYNFFLTYKKKNRFWHIFNIFHSLHTIFPALFPSPARVCLRQPFWSVSTGKARGESLDRNSPTCYQNHENFIHYANGRFFENGCKDTNFFATVGIFFC